MTQDPFVSRVRSAIGDVSGTASVPALRSKIAGVRASLHSGLEAIVAEAIRDDAVLVDETSRVLLARLIVAMLPFDGSEFERVLQETSPRIATSELQFSIFVALSELPEFESPSALGRVLQQVEGFVMSVETDETQAAWMAGDLLGDHWPLEQSLPALLRLAKDARHRAGREAALHGLSHALDRGDKRQQWEVVNALKAVASGDNDSQVRVRAQAILGPLRGF